MADPINPTFADWLKARALYATATADRSAFGDSAVETEIISTLAFKPDAVAEAARQLAALGGPLAIDEHVVEGRRASLIGRSIAITGDRLGYEAPARAFVIGVAEQEDGTTLLTVLKRL